MTALMTLSRGLSCFLSIPSSTTRLDLRLYEVLKATGWEVGFVYSMLCMGMVAETGGRRKAGRVKEYCKDYGTWHVFLVRVYCSCFLFLCTGFVGTEIEFVRRTREMRIEAYFSLLCLTRG